VVPWWEMKELELRRHAERTDADTLSAEGRAHAESVGRGLATDYAVVFVSPATRTAETVAWLFRGSGQPVPTHAVVRGLGSEVEDRWRAAAKAAGSSRLDGVSEADPGLVASESSRLARVIRDEILPHVPDGMKSLAVGHSPLIEAGVYGLMNLIIEPLRELEGVHLTMDEAGGLRIEELRLPSGEA
jgi:broad specificity phosphatase PhoE